MDRFAPQRSPAQRSVLLTRLPRRALRRGAGQRNFLFLKNNPMQSRISRADATKIPPGKPSLFSDAVVLIGIVVCPGAGSMGDFGKR